MTCDLSGAGAVEGFVTEAARALEGIDILINNASGFGYTDDEKGWLDSVNIDLLATVRATRATVPIMETMGGGAIVNIASIAALEATPRVLPYAAAKAALVNYTNGPGTSACTKENKGQRHRPRSDRISWRRMGQPQNLRSCLICAHARARSMGAVWYARGHRESGSVPCKRNGGLDYRANNRCRRRAAASITRHRA